MTQDDTTELRVWAPGGVPEVHPGDDLVALVLDALAADTDPATRRDLRRRVQLVFQDAGGSLDPRMPVRRSLEEARETTVGAPTAGPGASTAGTGGTAVVVGGAREARDEEIAKARAAAGLGPVHWSRPVMPTPLVEEGHLVAGAGDTRYE